LVFVGGGVGMAPLRAMIYQQIERSHVLPMTFFYGARTQADLLYREEFDHLSEANNGFTWIDALSEAEENWQGERGFIHTVLQKQFLSKHENPDRCDYYLCGPPLMIQGVLAVLRKVGVQDSHIFSDDFG
jgi:Na+-transporting NADH:ubiquinone oxidoreductase subunit F